MLARVLDMSNSSDACKLLSSADGGCCSAAGSQPAGPKRTPAEEELLAGTQGANMTRVLTALQDGANPNICDPKGRSPLHFSAGVGLP